jgi:hypothetical protein
MSPFKTCWTTWLMDSQRRSVLIRSRERRELIRPSVQASEEALEQNATLSLQGTGDVAIIETFVGEQTPDNAVLGERLDDPKVLLAEHAH